MSQTLRAWLQWFGLARLAVTAAAIVAVGAGGFWLLRTPATPLEQQLPMANRGSTTTTKTATPHAGSAGAPSPPSTAQPEPSTPPTEPAFIVVHVAGAVVRPGVVRLPSNARAEDAVAAVGGVATDADLDAMNLATRLRDGDRLYVPHLGQPVPSVVAPAGGAAVGQPTPVGAPSGPVDLNRATVEQLDALPGVGPSTAAAIVSYRDQHGPFGSVDDLLEVRGIGPAKLDAIRALVTV